MPRPTLTDIDSHAAGSPPAEPPPSPAGPPSDNQLERLWSEARDRLSRSLPETTFRMWLDPITPIAIRGSQLHLEAPASVRSWVERRYSDLISQSIHEISSALDGITFAPVTGEQESGDAPGSTSINPTHTFDRFVIGHGNHLAHSACLAVAEAPSESYNPLFIHGRPGLGKTHLLGAVANYLQVNAPALRVRYTNAEGFTSEFVRALKESGAEEFKRRYRDVDVLLIDDVQFLAGKQRTEEEFFHTFNALYDGGSQIVLSADRDPAEISTLTDRLRDRFEWGLTVSLDTPDLATRLAVLRRLALESGLELADPEALTLLARRVEANVRQLHGALTRSIAHASLRATPFSSALIAEVFPGQEREPAQLSPERIRAVVAEQLSVDEQRLTSSRRDAVTVRARHIAIYFTREMTDLSLPQIAQLYGRRDHTTVMNSVRRITEGLESDPELAAQVDRVRAAIHSPGA